MRRNTNTTSFCFTIRALVLNTQTDEHAERRRNIKTSHENNDASDPDHHKTTLLNRFRTLTCSYTDDTCTHRARVSKNQYRLLMEHHTTLHHNIPLQIKPSNASPTTPTRGERPPPLHATTRAYAAHLSRRCERHMGIRAIVGRLPECHDTAAPWE